MNLTELKNIFASLPIGIIVLENHRVIKYTNPVLTQTLQNHLTKPQLLAAVSKVLSEKRPVKIKGDMKEYLLEILTENLADQYTVFYLQDTTTSELEDNLYIYRELLNSITDLGLLAINKNEEIILYNEASAQQDQMRREDVIGRKFDDVFSKTVNGALTEALHTGHPVVNQEVIYTTSSGTNILSLSNAYPVIKDGETVAAFSMIHFHEDMQYLLQKTIELQQKLFNNYKNSNNNTRFHFSDIIGESPELLHAIDMAQKAAFTASPVLLYGETGTGKELFAQSIHNASPHSNSPFIALNCAAIPENLLESTLFGTTKGAFTGANNTPGLFEQAKDGTLFLDELNSMPVNLQSKLLRVLQEKSVRPLGGKEEIPVNCRIIASTNIPPMECVENGTIRADLYYRLSVICIEISPLRERGNDVLILGNYYIQKYSEIYGKRTKMTPEFEKILLNYSWPGNCRELEHVIESSLVFLEPKEDLAPYHLPQHIRSKFLSSARKTIGQAMSDGDRDSSQETDSRDYNHLKEHLEDIERAYIKKALKDNEWNITQTAKAIGYTRSNLQYRMSKLDISFSD